MTENFSIFPYKAIILKFFTCSVGSKAPNIQRLSIGSIFLLTGTDMNGQIAVSGHKLLAELVCMLS